MKLKICAAAGVVGSFIVSLLGGWDSSLVTLFIFVATDYITGLIVAGVFHNSSKSSTGALESKAGFKGLIRKCMIFVFVLICHRLDLEAGTDYFRNGVIIGFIVNEGISILENADAMGIKLPGIVKNALDIVKQKGERLNE